MSLLSARQLEYAVDGVSILRQVDFDLDAGELIGLIGPNGAGKSTLLRLLTGIQTPDLGTVDFGGQPLAQISPQQRARQLGYLVQGYLGAYLLVSLPSLAVAVALLRWRRRLE